jgi:hypothetical protein
MISSCERREEKYMICLVRSVRLYIGAEVQVETFIEVANCNDMTKLDNISKFVIMIPMSSWRVPHIFKVRLVWLISAML